MDKFEVYFGSRNNRSCCMELSVGLGGLKVWERK